MRVCLFCLVVAIVSASQALAENGRPSQSALDEMGLSGLQVMSDGDALSIRGHGYSSASAAGISWAAAVMKSASGSAIDRYNARGKYFAFGRSNSEVELIVKLSKGKRGHDSNYGGHDGDYGGHNKPKRIKLEVFSGGWSFAVIK